MKYGTLAAMLLAVCISTPVLAGTPWNSFSPFGSIEADASRAYPLKREHGPWLIVAATFSGEGAREQAHELVIEIRKELRLNAYSVQQHFDFTQPVEGLGVQQVMQGDPSQRGQNAPQLYHKVMRHRKKEAFDEIAVLVGDFDSIYDPKLKGSLEKIKQAWPESLDARKRGGTTQRRIQMLADMRRITRDPARRGLGPMRGAFVSRNPLLPVEYFAPKGLDPLVAKMNETVEHSLLKCPGKYTVKVATFRGRVTIDAKDVQRLNSTPQEYTAVDSQLAVAAEKAHHLTLALRQSGVEAFEFHDRHESVVTVGSFDSIGSRRADGKIEIDPSVHRLMESYKAKPTAVPGQPTAALAPRQYAGIYLDLQPVPVEVPRRSVAADHAIRGSVFDR